MIDDYCEYVFCNEHSIECKKLLMDTLQKDANVKNFFYMGSWEGYPTPGAPVNTFQQTHNAAVLGFAGPFPDWFEAQLPDFVQYAWHTIQDYSFNLSLSDEQYHNRKANRMMTTKILADLIGASDIIPRTRYIWLQIDGKKRLGISVDVAKGIYMSELKSGVRIAPNFQRETVMFNMLDLLSCGMDHEPVNFSVSFDDDGRVHGLYSFDNDDMGTLELYFRVTFAGFFMGGDNTSPFVTSEGYINRPFLDRDSANAVLRLSPRDVARAVREHTSTLECLALCVRFRKLQQAIRKSLSAGATRLLGREEWSTETIREELSGKYGKTYLKDFADHYHVTVED